MKFNKLIAKGLSVGLLINSVSTLSYANTEIPNRYQTLEGEHITIDDSTEGNLEEIEIFGNTVQDPNNLDDIQSVGDLYVDENGNPILDKQGRKQYKIEITSSNNNLYNLSKRDWIVGKYIDTDGTIKSNPYEGYDNNFINVSCLSGKRIYVSNFKAYELKVAVYDKNKEFLNMSKTGSYEIELNLPANATYIRIGHANKNIDNMIVCDSVYRNTYVSHQSNKTTILLPCQLQKIGNVADRLYWDSEKGRYIVEKNIKKVVLNGTENWAFNTTITNGNEYLCFCLDISDAYSYIGATNIINNKFPNRKVHEHVIAEEGMGFVGSTQLFFRIHESRLYDSSNSSLKEYLSNNNIEIFYWLKNAEIIETNITSKLKIPTYEDKTHIYVDSENNINPTLKVMVDRLPQIAKEAVAQAESDNTNYNISLARRYINMLPESSYKDQLQDQLSEIFSSDMVLDVKTATSNLDVYIKSENILQMSLDTNSISFDDFSGIEDVVKENAVNITINSSLPYQINAYLPAEIQNADKTKTLDKSILNIKENSQSNYQTFANTTDKIILKDNCSAGNQLTHGVDLKLAGGIAHEKDVYKATIKLEAEQK